MVVSPATKHHHRTLKQWSGEFEPDFFHECLQPYEDTQSRAADAWAQNADIFKQRQPRMGGIDKTKLYVLRPFAQSA